MRTIIVAFAISVMLYGCDQIKNGVDQKGVTDTLAKNPQRYSIYTVKIADNHTEGSVLLDGQTGRSWILTGIMDSNVQSLGWSELDTLKRGSGKYKIISVSPSNGKEEIPGFSDDSTTVKSISEEDKKAIDWARTHRDDPRSAQVLQLNGLQFSDESTIRSVQAGDKIINGKLFRKIHGKWFEIVKGIIPPTGKKKW